MSPTNVEAWLLRGIPALAESWRVEPPDYWHPIPDVPVVPRNLLEGVSLTITPYGHAAIAALPEDERAKLAAMKRGLEEPTGKVEPLRLLRLLFWLLLWVLHGCAGLVVENDAPTLTADAAPPPCPVGRDVTVTCQLPPGCNGKASIVEVFTAEQVNEGLPGDCHVNYDVDCKDGNDLVAYRLIEPLGPTGGTRDIWNNVCTFEVEP